MKFSTKSRYGLRALFDIAYHTGTLPAQVKEISRRQDISPRYLEQIFQDLKKAGLLKSKRGPQGGYSLARKPEEITVCEIIRATEGELNLVDCTKHKEKLKGELKKCQMEATCVTKQVWVQAGLTLSEYFSSITLKDLCEEAKELGIEREMDHRFMYYI